MLKFTLSDILTIVNKGQKALFGGFSFWLETEMHKIRKVGNNYYSEMIEFDDQHNIKAKITGIIFDATIVSNFQRKTGINLLKSDNITLLIKGKLHFHKNYGTSIIINEISSQYSLGNITEQKKHILAKLQQEWIHHNNKHLPAPVPPLTIALVCGAKSQGAKDFLSVLEQSPYQYNIVPYHTAVHGNTAKESVLQTLQKIKEDCSHVNYSYVVITRWGGESSWMLRQNDEKIARAICHLSVPTIVAVWHTSDTSVLDQIAYHTAKTPTDAAYICQEATEKYHLQTNHYLAQIHQRVQTKIHEQKTTIDTLLLNINSLISHHYTQTKNNIEKRYTAIQQKDPSKLKHQGYGIIQKDGTYITPQKLKELGNWDELTIDIYDHTLTVKITKNTTK